jgi:hypothetical protein
MTQFGIQKDPESTARPPERPRRAPIALIQIAVWTVIAWAFAGLLGFFLQFQEGVSWGHALAIGALLSGILMLIMGVFTLASGGIATYSDALAWIGVPIQTRGGESGPAGALTMFGVSLFVGPPLLIVGLLTL